jgi:WD40 repeat protein
MKLTKRNIRVLLLGITGLACLVWLAFRLQADDPALIKVIEIGDRGRRVAWSPDGKRLLVAMINEEFIISRGGSSIKLWDVESGQVRETVAEDFGKGLAFQHVAYSADGKSIAASVVMPPVTTGTMTSIHTAAKVWDSRTLELKRTLGTQCGCLAFSKDGKLLAIGDYGKNQVDLWNVETGALERTLDTKPIAPHSLAFSPDGTVLVVSGALTRATNGPTGNPNSFSIKDSKGKEIWQVQCYSTQSGIPQPILNQEGSSTLVGFTSEGRLILRSDDNSLQIWDVQQQKLIQSLPGICADARCVAISPNGQMVATGGRDWLVRVWELQGGILIAKFRGHRAEVYSAAFSPDNNTLATTGQDRTIRLWNVKLPREEK